MFEYFKRSADSNGIFHGPLLDQPNLRQPTLEPLIQIQNNYFYQLRHYPCSLLYYRLAIKLVNIKIAC